MLNPTARLEIRKSGVALPDFVLNQEMLTLGRAPDNQLCLSEDLAISRYHAQLSWALDSFLITDVGSSDGTFLNGSKLVPHVPHPLTAGDRIRLGGTFELIFQVDQPDSLPVSSAEKGTVAMTVEMQFPHLPAQSQTLSLRNQQRLNIGRDPGNGVVIDHPAVSRFHAQIRLEQGNHQILDLGSMNGTFVNGQPITEPKALRVGDVIRIGPSSFVFQPDESLIQTNEQGNLRLDALHLKKVVGRGLNLLQDISLSIQPREFVAIAGVSGGGKSTLMYALTGLRPATSGNVLVNEVDLYRNFNAYRTEIGYVPQRDIVHMELTVEEALDFAAQLRMPADTTRVERRQRVDEVLVELNLSHRRRAAIQSLSGGQLKRVSIGVELLTKPSLFFLDEATSGLDPGMETELMHLLRTLADQGRTVLLITHATENVMLCDQVIFLARGGNMAFFGPPQEALSYFGVTRFNQIYRRVEHECTPEEWQGAYQRSHQYRQYVLDRQAALPKPSNRRLARPRQPLPGSQVKRISGWRQFLILSHRNLAILLRDRISLALMLAVAPLLGLLDFVAWPHTLLDVREGSSSLTISMLFTSILIAVMVGSLSTMREIVKEIDIYRRERVVGLQIAPYVFSKVWIAVLLSLYQAAIFLLFKVLAIDLPSSPAVLAGLYVTLFLATLGGMMMGLLGSAIAPNQSVAPMIVLILLVPQILFGGGVLPIDTFGPPGQILNRLSLTKWPFETLATLSGFGRDVIRDPCWQLPEAERQNLKNEDKQKCICMGANIFKTCKFPGVLDDYDPAIDQPAPPQPKAPTPPTTPSFEAQQQYQKDLEQYQTKVKQWQETYSKWKIKYDGAIARAENTIDSLKQKFGNAFDVSVPQHWLIFGGFLGVMLGLTIAIQKLKDFL